MHCNIWPAKQAQHTSTERLDATTDMDPQKLYCPIHENAARWL